MSATFFAVVWALVMAQGEPVLVATVTGPMTFQACSVFVQTAQTNIGQSSCVERQNAAVKLQAARCVEVAERGNVARFVCGD
jgi:hypothetical protein